jgi:Leucine-rich repeat (LRR) protein
MGNGDSTAQQPHNQGHDPNKHPNDTNANTNNANATETKLTEIDLSDKNITELTKDLTKYEALEVVNLNNNKLSSLRGIFMLNKIRELSISNNLLKKLDEEFFFLKQLQKVLNVTLY